MLPLKCGYLTCFALVLSFGNTNLSAGEKTKYLSHPPMRPLPVPAKRPMGKGPAYFVDPVKGSDRQEGTAEKPWKTVNQAVKRLKPGDTLYLRGGIYYECVTLTAVGTPEMPITVR